MALAIMVGGVVHGRFPWNDVWMIGAALTSSILGAMLGDRVVRRWKRGGKRV